FPLVMISPSDSAIITEGSEERRKFIDNVISQTDNRYLDTLIHYNRILLQRNTLLKNIKETGIFDIGLLEILNMQLTEVGEVIYQRRKLFMEEFLPSFQRHYGFLSEGAEDVSLVYDSDLHH